MLQEMKLAKTDCRRVPRIYRVSFETGAQDANQVLFFKSFRMEIVFETSIIYQNK